MNMNKLKNRQLIQDAIAIILIDVSEENKIPAHWPLPKHTNELANFLIALDFEWDLDRIEALTKNTLDKTANIIVNAHKIASRAQIASPDKETMKKIRKDLKGINKTLKNEQRFRVAFDFAINIGKMAERVG